MNGQINQVKYLKILVYGCIDKLTVRKNQKKHNYLTFRCKYRIYKKMKIWTSNGKRSLYYWSQNEKLELTKYEKVSKSWTLYNDSSMSLNNLYKSVSRSSKDRSDNLFSYLKSKFVRWPKNAEIYGNMLLRDWPISLK